MANLVIMESPAKANTVKSYLGSSYKVVASTGHVRDLPKSTLGIDIDNDFEAQNSKTGNSILYSWVIDRKISIFVLILGW